ncbi:MAG: hypothetical protein GJV46_01050 [Geobacter sp.]|nr:hypothetical protein [Geobacter sp.]
MQKCRFQQHIRIFSAILYTRYSRPAVTTNYGKEQKMCGRFTALLTPELLSETFGVQLPESIKPRYNIAPTQNIPLVRIENDGQRHLSYVRWGQATSWANDLAIGTDLINTAAEILSGEPKSDCLTDNCRGIVPANGFYIWQDGCNKKQPWYVTRKDGGLMAFAGLLSRWRTPGGNEIDTCTIITTAANDLIRPIHSRMPTTIAAEELSLWLSASRLSPGNFHSILKTLPPDLLEVYPVDSNVNQPACDTADCIKPYQYH